MDKMDKYIGKYLDNRYEILEVIGTGGMAIVYKALCHRLNRFVAVKILKDEYAQDDDFRRRFHAESQAVAMLSHPNIVSVYDVSRSGEVEYIVMELIEGITLKQYMQRREKLNWREALHFVTQILKGLSHAHGRGIIHRDIKPHNIMILRDGSVKVADFGIARFTAKQNTLTQEALGSVHYISPEQARGSRIDARSDIYSVGVVLYEMLTFRLPFEGDSPVSVAIQHINSMPLAPREINPDIPEALEAITLKAMASDVERRYASADTMLHDLEEFRKNPNISFDFQVADFAPDSGESEPTQPLATPRDTHGGKRSGAVARRNEDDYYQPRKRKKPNTPLLAAIVAILVFLAGMFYLLMTLLGPLFNGEGGDAEEFAVPQLKGELLEEILENEEYSENFKIVEVDSVYDVGTEAGRIISQTPVAETMVKKGATINVTVSLGEKTTLMPDLVDVELRQAQLQLDDLGLKYRAPQYESSADVVADHIIRTEPEANTLLSEGEYVVIVVSSGPEVKMTAVPDVVGKSQRQAISMLEAAGLKVGELKRVDSDEDEDTVIFQSRVANSEVEQNTAVDLQISNGALRASPSPEQPSPSPSPSSGGGSGVVRNKWVRIELNQSVSSVLVTIKQDGVIVHNEVHETTQGYFDLLLQGSGVAIVDVYYDGVQSRNFNVDFDS